MILSLINTGKIKTTEAKGKAIHGLIDKLVSKAKDGSQSAVRQLQMFLARTDQVNKLVKDIAPRFSESRGGYVRMRKLGKRKGDAAEEVILEWSVQEKKENAKQAKVKEKTVPEKMKKDKNKK